MVVGRDVRDLGDGVADPDELRQCALRQDAAVELELQRGDDREQVGVAGTLAVAVRRPLHVRCAGPDRRERVGHGTRRVVVRVDAHA